MAAKEILVVDDEIGIRELLSEILFDEGYRVSVAENAAQAREYRIRQAPDLVLLDIWMPDTDGVFAAAGMGGRRLVDDAGHYDVRPRHHRNCGGSDAHRCGGFSGKTRRLA